jgi:hypothetical protein
MSECKESQSQNINIVEEAHKVNKLANDYLNGPIENQGNAAFAMLDEIHKMRDAGGIGVAKQVFEEAKKSISADTKNAVNADWTESADHSGASISFSQASIFKTYANLTMGIKDDGRSGVRAGLYRAGTYLYFGDRLK